MALTTIPSELSSVSGISDSSTSTAITIDSSQNVTFAGNITTGSNTISGVLSSVTGSLGSAATATTQAASDNSTKLATTAYVTTALANMVDSAPSTLDTLNELAAALGDDANFSTTVTNSIATKAPIANPTFTGSFTSPGIDDNADATAITIDSSENVLVGKSTTALATAGLTFGAAGFASLTRSGAEPLNVNRLSSDGNLVVFYKDGSTVGSIGSVSGTDIELNSTLSGSLSAGGTKRFGWNTSGVFFPHTDNANDLGASASRFKDLYLSGTATVGTATTGMVAVGSSNSFQIQKSGTHGYINQSDSGDLIVRMGSSFSEAMRINSNRTIAVNSTATNRELTIAAITSSGQCDLALRAADDNNYCQLLFGDTSADNTGIVGYKNGDEFMFFNTGGAERMRISGSNVAIGTSTVLDGLNIYGSSATNLRLHNGTTGVSTSAGGIIQQAGDELYLWNYEPSNLIFGTNNAQRIRIRSDGNVGIGSNGMPAYSGNVQLSLGQMAHFMADTGSYANGSLHISQNAHFDADGSWETMETDEASNYYQNAGTHNFRVAPSTSAGTDITWLTAFLIKNNGSLTMNGQAGSSPIFEMINNDNEDTDTGRETSIRFSGHRSGGEDVINAQISAHHDGSADDDKGMLFFYTNNGSGLNLALRINSSGHIFSGSNGAADLGLANNKWKDIYADGTLYIGGRTSVIGTADLAGYAQPGNTFIETQNTTTGTTHYAAIFRKNDTNAAGSIQVSNTATAYVTSSDYRLKENVTTLEDGLERVKKLKPVKFNWVDDDTETEGFIAHEMVEAGWSEGVMGEKDAVDEDGNIQPQQVDYGRITPLLVKAIQEQQTLIETLQAEVAALKGA